MSDNSWSENRGAGHGVSQELESRGWSPTGSFCGGEAASDADSQPPGVRVHDFCVCGCGTTEVQVGRVRNRRMCETSVGRCTCVDGQIEVERQLYRQVGAQTGRRSCPTLIWPPE